MDNGAGDGTCADRGVQDGIVGHDDDTVFGDGHIGFQSVNAGRNGKAEGGQGVFRPTRTGTAMAVNLNSFGAGDEAGKRKLRG